ALAVAQDNGGALGLVVTLTWMLACLAVMLLGRAPTALAGPIAYVGLVAPPLPRQLARTDQPLFLPIYALFGRPPPAWGRNNRGVG
ncbi:iron chelate uptake ABC transporter family permease subunit, partial [Pseudomonas aeruginosa]|uniref:iron chelate uptake ABC transporter family permease subunit n=1 Tax=Pseudomonas aeruginosa TaxID=287 RepID=UPI003CC69E6E